MTQTEMVETQARVADLAQIVSREVLGGMGLRPLGLPYRLARVLVRPGAVRMARLLAQADAEAGQCGLHAAGEVLLERLATSCTAQGAEGIPAEGPVLITANHPGGLELLALLAQIRRPDLRVLSNPQPFLMAMPHVSPAMLYLSADSGGYFTGIRQVVRHLQAGHVVIVFPAGQMEPDPGVTPGAVEFLERWSVSTRVYLHKVPETRLVPAVLTGIVSPRAVQSLFVRGRTPPKARQRTAAFLQLLVQLLARDRWPIHIRLAFGAPVGARELSPELDPQALTAGVRAQTAGLLEGLGALPSKGVPFTGA